MVDNLFSSSVPGIMELKRHLGWSAKTIWLLGKGPTATWRQLYLSQNECVITLNHACEFVSSGLAHFADLDALDDCVDWLARSRSLIIVVPDSIHINNVSRGLRVTDILYDVPFLRQLHVERRLFTYSTSTGDWYWRTRQPVIVPKFFSSEAAYQIAVHLGARDIKTLGIGGGDDYSPDVGTRGQRRHLINGRTSYRRQADRLRYLEAKFGVTMSSVPALPIFVGASHHEIIPFLVLRHSLIRHSSKPIQITILPKVPIRYRFLLRHGTPFTFARFQIPKLMNFQGRAIYLDSDILAFDDIAALFAVNLHSCSVGLVKASSSPASFAQNPNFKPGRQTSVMVIDCERAQWNLQSILRALRKGNLTYNGLMCDLAFQPHNLIFDDIDPSWNSLDRFESGVTRLLHFTNIPTQPWRRPDAPLSEIWLGAFQRAVREGAIPRVALESAVRRGDVYRGLLDEFDKAQRTVTGTGAIDPGIAAILASHRSSALLIPFFRLKSICRSLVWKIRRQMPRSWRLPQ